MKKTLLFAALLGMVFASCQQKSEPEVSSDPTYRVASDGVLSFSLETGKQKNVSFYIKSANGLVVSSNIDVNIKADESKVATFNQGRDTVALLLPSTAYTFSSTTLRVYKNNKKSLETDVKISLPETLQDTTYVLPISIDSFSGTDIAKVAEDGTVFIVVKKLTSLIDKGNGTKNKPYLIYTKQDLLDMHTECVDSTEAPDGCVYFKMMNDVDLGMTKETADDWEPINFNSPYYKKVNFNGNGKTIKNLVSIAYKYASFLGVVFGEVYDVTFDNCYIEGECAIGVVGGYIGTTGIAAYCHDIKVTNSEVNCTLTSGKNGVGGIGGRITATTLERCSFDGIVRSGRDYTGGIFGYDNGTSIIKDCSTSGTLIAKAQRAGAIGGGLIKADSKIQNCFTTMGIYSSSLCVGGIVGHCNLDKKDAFYTPNNEISGCIAWNDSISVRKTTWNQWSTGAIVGFSAPSNVLKNCYRKNGLQAIIDDPAAAANFTFVNHDGEYGPSNLLPTSCWATAKQTDDHIGKYDGKEAGATQTATDVAKVLNYDATIWDLTGATPKLK